MPARDTVPVGPIREAMLATGLPKRTLARKLGLPKRTVARLMGAPDYRISPVTGRRLGPYVQENVMGLSPRRALPGLGAEEGRGR